MVNANPREMTVENCNIFCPEISKPREVKNFWLEVCVKRQAEGTDPGDDIFPCNDCRVGEAYLGIHKYGDAKALEHYVHNIFVRNAVPDSVKFRFGNKVRWVSSSRGFVKSKKGVIVEVVKVGCRPNRKFIGLYRGHGCGAWRAEESYVVEVIGKGNRVMHYWPQPARLGKWK